jgi:mttA/Hcf106 family
MFLASPDSVVLATYPGEWEVGLILAVLLILLGAKRLPEVLRGMGNGFALHPPAGSRADEACNNEPTVAYSVYWS